MSTPPVPPHGPDDLEPDPTGIRALLRSLPEPGPMPAHLVDRITASIAAEQSAREDRTVVPISSHRRWGWRQLGAVAAAVAVIGVAVPALLSGNGAGDLLATLSGGAASDSAARSSAESPAPATTSSPQVFDAPTSAPDGQVTLTASGTAYTVSGLAAQASRAMSTAQESQPAQKDTGRGALAATGTGLRACLSALGVAARAPVWGDVGTYDGKPAIVAVVGTGAGQVVYAVPPQCDAAHPTVLAGPLPLP